MSDYIQGFTGNLDHFPGINSAGGDSDWLLIKHSCSVVDSSDGGDQVLLFFGKQTCWWRETKPWVSCSSDWFPNGGNDLCSCMKSGKRHEVWDTKTEIQSEKSHHALQHIKSECLKVQFTQLRTDVHILENLLAEGVYPECNTVTDQTFFMFCWWEMFTSIFKNGFFFFLLVLWKNLIRESLFKTF